MKQERLMQVLLSPHTSEKGSRLADKHRQFVFRVAPEATKPDVKKAVELMFKVEVEGVQILNTPGKRKRFGRRLGERPGWKKAYVCLKPDYDIDFVGRQ